MATRKKKPEVKSDEEWIQKMKLKKGALRRTLGAKKGEPITEAMLAKKEKQKGIHGKTKKRIALARTFMKMNKSK